MTVLKIDNREFEIEKLSEPARQHVQNINVVEEEIRRLNVQLAIYQTARSAYLAALRTSLPKD
jgi:Family of unknown function (DUF6447)